MLCVTLLIKSNVQASFHVYMGFCTVHVPEETALSIISHLDGVCIVCSLKCHPSLHPMDNFSDYIVCCPLNVDKNRCLLLLLILVNRGNYYQ